MKDFNRLLIITLLLIGLIFAAANILLHPGNERQGRQYRVDVTRATAVIAEYGLDQFNLSDYETICAVIPIEKDTDLTGGEQDYLIREAGGKLYRFDYTTSTDTHTALPIINILLGIMAAMIIALLLYVRAKILKPFAQIRELPIALSKGNLTAPIQENRQHFFGRFVWGMNMLRESIEVQKERELSLQAEKKRLILSISHDIKIPLSAIKLYAKAMEKGLYDDTQRLEIAGKINEKADEITGFVSRIVQASNEDFLALDVNNGEFYLSSLLDQVRLYYTEKLRLLDVAFHMDKTKDCLLTGDLNRSLEVIQNIVENAIKYGDGKSIDIHVTSEERCRLITVENSGCTLSQDEIPHMFDSFWRGTNATKEEGSGLGLYICRTLMMKMGGDIFAECTGNTMRITVVFYCA